MASDQDPNLLMTPLVAGHDSSDASSWRRADAGWFARMLGEEFQSAAEGGSPKRSFQALIRAMMWVLLAWSRLVRVSILMYRPHHVLL